MLVFQQLKEALKKILLFKKPILLKILIKDFLNSITFFFFKFFFIRKKLQYLKFKLLFKSKQDTFLFLNKPHFTPEVFKNIYIFKLFLY